MAEGHLHVCEALLSEAREQGYPFTPEEWRYVDSLDGVLWLRRGVAHQQNGKYQDAETCYQRSLEIQNRLRHAAAQGQVKFVFHILKQETSTGQRDPYLDTIQKELTVLGDSDAVLCRRLKHATDVEKSRILTAAVEMRLVQPLLRALDCGNDRAAMLAAAGLARFTHADQQDALLTGVNSRNWFVRWRAADALGEDHQSPKSLVPTLAEALRGESDPEVRRALALSLGTMEDHRSTAVLIAALADTDPEVRWAAATALAASGDRGALADLRDVTNGNDYFGRSIRKAAQEAIQKIEDRHPLFKVRGCRTCRPSRDGRTMQYDTKFWPDETAFIVVDVSGARSTTQIRVRVMDSQGIILYEREGAYAALHGEASHGIAPEKLLLRIHPPQRGRWPLGRNSMTLDVCSSDTATYERAAKVSVWVLSHLDATDVALSQGAGSQATVWRQHQDFPEPHYEVNWKALDERIDAELAAKERPTRK